jgi:hypothetical protein
MTLWHAVLFFLATFAQVFLLGFQSRNVNSGQFVAAASTSFLIGAAQIFVVRGIALSDPWVAFAITSVAGPSAIVTAMLLHRRLFKSS